LPVNALSGSAIYGNGLFVCRPSSGSGVFISADGGVSWNTASTPPLPIDIIYTAGIFVLIAYDGTVHHSLDAASWTQVGDLSLYGWVWDGRQLGVHLASDE
jgi:hypothetical protein